MATHNPEFLLERTGLAKTRKIESCLDGLTRDHLLKHMDLFLIKRVIFNNPATIVIWSDKTKTVVKCQEGDTYDKEKGLLLCFTKRFLGNKSRYLNDFLNFAKEGDDDGTD